MAARSHDDVPEKYHTYLRCVWPQRSVEEDGKKGMVFCMDYTLLQPSFELSKVERGRVRLDWLPWQQQKF